MNVAQLRYFVALADTSNFHRAGDLLGIAQPPISVGIRKLEEELGVTLFDRSRRHVALTDAGRALIEDARLAVLHIDQLRNNAKEAAVGRYGRLRIAFIGSVTYDLLPRLLRAFRSSYPNVQLDLEESRTIDILTALQKRTIDIGLVRLPILDAAGVAVDVIEDNDWLVALGSGSPLTEYSEIALEILADQPFIVHSRDSVPNMYAMVMLLCSQAGFQPHIVEQAIQVQTLLSLVAGGLGIALVPSNISETITPGITFRPLKRAEGAPRIGIGIAVAAEPLSVAARCFRKVALSGQEKI